MARKNNLSAYVNPLNAFSLVIVIAGVAAIMAIRKAFGKSKSERAAEANAEMNVVDSINYSEVASKRTLTDAQITAMANAIRSAWGGIFNDDEDAVYAQFSKINNIYDLYALIQRYGTNKGRTLEEDIRKRLSNKEVEQINKILSVKNINFSF